MVDFQRYSFVVNIVFILLVNKMFKFCDNISINTEINSLLTL